MSCDHFSLINSVSSFQATSEADPQRTLTSRILLKWSQHPEGPRANARLVVCGHNDAYALAGQRNTASPAPTKPGSECFLSMSPNSVFARPSTGATSLGQISLRCCSFVGWG
jgi:hypothetical protein